jgi:hypothetical protein
LFWISVSKYNGAGLEDSARAENTGSSLAFGEILPESVSVIFDTNHLNGTEADTFVDLGSGYGKVVVQAYLEHPTLKKAVGVELTNKVGPPLSLLFCCF